jgi:hypothetical protein
MHYLAQKVRQGQANMGQNLHSIRVAAQKAEHDYENKVLVFLFMLPDCF